MTKKKSLNSALTKTVPPSQWSKIKAAERITYDQGAPARSSWQTSGTYTGGELSYRGQQERRSFVSLAGRALP